MPDSSDSSGTSSDTAQSSLLRLTRRHSLPASTTLSTFLSLWSAENAWRNTTVVDDSPNSTSTTHYQQQRQQQQGRNRRASLSGATLLNGINGSTDIAGERIGGNRHRYGHRHTRSAAQIVDRPVIVKSYNPEAAVSRNSSPPDEDEDSGDLSLPSVDSFSFDGILKAIDPAVTTALDAVSKLCAEYQTTLKAEVNVLIEAQAEIDAAVKETDKLTTQALKTTRIRTERLDAEAVGLKGGATVDALAAAAEATHTTLTSIITTLLAIDEMLPPQERLSPVTSAHKGHYPKVHTLLADKAHQIELRFRNVRSPELRPTSRPLSMQALSLNASADDPGESSSGQGGQDQSVWSRRRLSSATLLDSPVLSRSSTFSQNSRGVSSPHLQLRTILPSPSNNSNTPISASGSYFPIASRTATGLSLTSPLYKAAQLVDQQSLRLEQQSSQMPTKRSSGMWARRSSTSTLTAFMISERGSGEEGEPASGPSPRTPSTWRHSAGSWAGFFGGKSSWGSGGGGGGGESRVSAEERLKKLLEGGEKGKGKGKGKGVVGRQ